MLNISYKRDKTGKIIAIKTSLSGIELLKTPKLNKGCAFNNLERDQFALNGKLPYCIQSMDEQLARVYKQYQQKNNDLQKYVYLNGLHETNEVLFYQLLTTHLTEMLPIVYTPTIGEAVKNYSLEFRRARGLFINYHQQDNIETILSHRVNQDIDLVLVTDGEGVLGIGDQGIGGMSICIGKLMVYTACGGINPNRVLPIQLDVGTNNKILLNDPNYLGWRHPRIEGPDYDRFINRFVQAIKSVLPRAFLHWEDFGVENAHKNLAAHRNELATFNDDIEGTGATVLACLLAGLKASKQKLIDQKIVLLGAGTAGTGVAAQIHSALVQSGLTEQEAYNKFWLVDRDGLLLTSNAKLLPFQQPFARSPTDISDWQVDNADHISLLDTVRHVQPTLLIGCSTAHGAFTEDIIRAMAQFNQHPLIFPLSNPTALSEATPQDIIKWTDGTALIGTGSPFPPVTYKDHTYTIAQCNNAYIFPGLGLGVIIAQASRLTPEMIKAACDTLADHSPALKDIKESLLPPLTDSQPLSKTIALAVAKTARQQGVARISEDVDIHQAIEAYFWEPEYLPLEKM